jgi:ankyrin repeat protein
LISAANRNDPEIVKLLLEAGADVNTTVSDSWTALMEACREGNLPIVKHLLESGADVNAKNSIGSTALGVAEEHGAPREIIDLLLAHGARGGSGDLPQ